MIVRIALTTLAALALAALTPANALADGAQATALRIAVPARVDLGQAAQVQAQLTDAAGKPVVAALVVFTAPLGFLEASGDVVLAAAVTDRAGIASGEVQLRTEGKLTITAAFKGDAQHAPSSASAPIEVASGGQLYAQTAGVPLPGLNAPPAVPPGTNAALLDRAASLWPAMSGWPIALALMIVWSLYASVVVILFRIVGAARKAAA